MEKSFPGATYPTRWCPTGVVPYPLARPGLKKSTHVLRGGVWVFWGHSPSGEILGFPGVDHLGHAPHTPAIGQLQVIAGVAIEVAAGSAEAVGQGGTGGHRHLAEGAEEHVHPRSVGDGDVPRRRGDGSGFGDRGWEVGEKAVHLQRGETPEMG